MNYTIKDSEIRIVSDAGIFIFPPLWMEAGMEVPSKADDATINI
jgi:hypothetical protein